MSLLVNLAAREIDKNCQSARANVDAVMENLNDIMMYLNVNRLNLPNGSEVSIEELFSLMNRCLSESECISRELQQQKNWIKAVIEQK